MPARSGPKAETFQQRYDLTADHGRTLYDPSARIRPARGGALGASGCAGLAKHAFDRRRPSKEVKVGRKPQSGETCRTSTRRNLVPSTTLPAANLHRCGRKESEPTRPLRPAPGVMVSNGTTPAVPAADAPPVAPATVRPSYTIYAGDSLMVGVAARALAIDPNGRSIATGSTGFRPGKFGLRRATTFRPGPDDRDSGCRTGIAGTRAERRTCPVERSHRPQRCVCRDSRRFTPTGKIDPTYAERVRQVAESVNAAAAGRRRCPMGRTANRTRTWRCQYAGNHQLEACQAWRLLSERDAENSAHSCRWRKICTRRQYRRSHGAGPIRCRRA